MTTVTIRDAKTNLSKLIEQVQGGEDVVIVRGDKPVTRLVPIEAKPKPKRQFGALRGKVTVTDAFFEPLPPEELDAWEQ